MEIQFTQEKDGAVVAPKGRIDAVTSLEFESFVKDLIGKGQSLFVLNFDGLEYISSAGLRSILAIAKILKAKNGRLVFAALKDTVRNVFKISGFESMFVICETQEEALRKLAA